MMWLYLPVDTGLGALSNTLFRMPSDMRVVWERDQLNVTKVLELRSFGEGKLFYSDKIGI